ncbi:MAG: glycine oxidase ThiO [Actinomycetes bacterium]
MSDSPDVCIIGAGPIGLAVAWRAAQRGMRVVVLDPDPGAGASWAAAGMLAAVTELHFGEEALLALDLASARAWPGFADELVSTSNRGIGYRTEGTLVVAGDADDGSEIDRLRSYQESLGLTVTALGSTECRQLEPMLSPGVHGGMLVAGDHQVDPRLMVQALLVVAAAAGVRLIRSAAAGLLVNNGRVDAVLLTDGTRMPAGTVVVAAGAASGLLARVDATGAPTPAGSDAPLVPIRPVKGQTLRLRGAPGSRNLLTRTVRALVGGVPVYLVPRLDGEIVIGATSEEMGRDLRVTGGGVYQLLRDAHEVVPGILELELVETVARARPGSPDNAPLLGPGPLPGLVLGTGHYRNGILLTPVTADALAEFLAVGTLPPVARPFAMDRLALPGRSVPAGAGPVGAR